MLNTGIFTSKKLKIGVTDESVAILNILILTTYVHSSYQVSHKRLYLIYQ